MLWFVCLFVCVEVLRPSQLNGVMLSAVSLPNHTFTGHVHILSSETDNCPSWISGRERMTVENISRSISMKECCWPLDVVMQDVAALVRACMVLARTLAKALSYFLNVITFSLILNLMPLKAKTGSRQHERTKDMTKKTAQTAVYLSSFKVFQ